MSRIPSPPDIETDLVIIGAGVSGITLADKLADTGIDFWLLGSPFESQLAKAGIVENTPLPEGTVGLKHIESEMDKLNAKNVNHRSSLCTGIEPQESVYKVLTKFQNFVAKAIVIATGNKQKSLGFDGEGRLFRKGISDCTVCDYPLFRERPTAVVGNHEYTVRAAKLMAKHTPTVSLLWYQSDSAPELENVQVYNNVSNLKAFGGEVLERISFDHQGGTEELEVHALFVEGQPAPSTSFLSPLTLDLNNEYIEINDNFETSAASVWAIGDITGKSSSYEEARNHALKLFELLVKKLG